MNTKSGIKIRSDGVVCCSHGTIRHFAEDISEFIIPLLDGSIVAEFNGWRISVNQRDNADTICGKFFAVNS